jgi:DNA-binding MarR family transcriptional regulator
MMQGGRDLSARFLDLLFGLVVGLIIGWLAHFAYAHRQAQRAAIPEQAKDSLIMKQQDIVLPEDDFSSNEEKILTEIIRHGTVKQSDLPDLVGLSRSNVSEVITRLEQREYIKKRRKGRTFLIAYIDR